MTSRLKNHRTLATILVVVACVFLVVTLLTGYARYSIFNADRFANHATQALENDDVKNLIASKLADDFVVRADPDLIIARPLVETVVRGIVGSQAFINIFHTAVEGLHRTVFERDSDTVLLTLQNFGVTLQKALAGLDPQIANQINTKRSAEVLQREPPGVMLDLFRLAESIRALAVLLAILTLVFFAGAIFVSPDWRRTLRQIGVGIIGSGVFVIVIWQIGHQLFLSGTTTGEEQAGANAIWDAFVGGLHTAAFVLAILGIIIVATAQSLIRRVEFMEPAKIWEKVTTIPETTTGRILRAGLLVVIGVVLIVQREIVLTLALILLGLYLLYRGVEELMRWIVSSKRQSGTGGN